MDYNRLVLNNDGTTFCEDVFSNFSVMELFIIWLNYYDEKNVRNFMISYRDQDPEVNFEQRVFVSNCFERENMWM